MKTFSPEDWENVPSKTEVPSADTVKDSNQSSPSYYNSEDTREKVEHVVQLIEQSGVDITAGYDVWVKIGFALASEFKNAGRGFFHRVSRLNTEYDARKTDKQFNKCLSGKGSGITIATFFQMAKDAGIDIHNTKVPNGNMELLHFDGNEGMKISETNIQNAKMPNIQMALSTGDWIKDADELPHLPGEVYSALPPFLKKLTDSASEPKDKDVILLGSIITLSSTLQNIRAAYDSRIVYPNLYLYVIADAGMGKGMLSLCRNLVQPIHEERLAIAHHREEESEDGGEEGKKKDSENKWYMHIIPANSSSTAFMEILDDNDGIGLMFETEGDTLANTFRQDYGNYSAALRKAFHHETISYTRRKDHEYVEIKSPRLSVGLSGTQDQVRALIPDTENGLMSRFIYYHLPFKQGFRDVFACRDISDTKDTLFLNFGEQYKRKRESFARFGEFVFSLTPIQEGDFRTKFSSYNDSCVEDIENSIQGLVFRMALITFRIMMVLSALRVMDEHPYLNRTSTSLRLVCSDDDYHTAMLMADALLKHSVYYYFMLSKNLSSGNSTIADRKVMLLNALPELFTKQDFTAAADRLGFKKSTTDKWIPCFIRQCLIERTDHGGYRKIHHDDGETDTPRL